MKAFAIQFAGQSIYIPYIGLGLSLIFILPSVVQQFLRYFTAPMTAILALSLFYYWHTGYEATVFVFAFKIGVLFALAALYIHLLQIDERAVMRFLFLGAAVSVAYMVYQAVSVAAFGAGLPFTSIEAFQIGRGLGSRFGIVRTTGFTEEPSYAAVMMIGTGLMLRSYEIRSGEKQKKRYYVLLLGLILCTSNSLFATLPLLALFSFCYFLRVPLVFFILFYAVNLAITPIVVNIDETFFARFTSYSQFLKLPVSDWWLGIGFNQYSTLPTPVFISDEGIPTLAVDSIASLWGGVLLEGGIVFATMFCLYVDRLTRAARDSTGYALMAILIMLANYYSPWWPVVSLALAYTIVSRKPRIEVAQ
ncbi:hypothetical protein BH11ARM2_BH11ARM2_10630 [soil metagenome]